MKIQKIKKILMWVSVGIISLMLCFLSVFSILNKPKTQTASADSYGVTGSGYGTSNIIFSSSVGTKDIVLGQLLVGSVYLVNLDFSSSIDFSRYGHPTINYSSNSTASVIDYITLFYGIVSNSSQPYYSNSNGKLQYRYSLYFTADSNNIAHLHCYIPSNIACQYSIVNITDITLHFYNSGFAFGQNSVDTSSFYNSGYEAGYDVGYSDGLETGTSSGYAQGFGEGLVQGLTSSIDYAQYFADGFNDGLISKYGTLQNAEEYEAGYAQAQTDVANANTTNINLVGRYSGVFDKYTEISYEATYDGFSQAFETWYQTGFDEAYDSSNKLDYEDYIKARFDIYDLIDLGYTAGSNYELTIPDAAKRAFVAGYYEYIQTNSTYLTYFNNGYDTGYNTDLTTMYNNFKVQGGLGGKEVGYDLGQQDGLSYGNGSGGGIDIDVQAIYQNGYNAGITYADGRLNTDSESYSVGYDNGYSDGIVNSGTSSTEAYHNGYNVGKTVGYQLGHQDGLDGVSALNPMNMLLAPAHSFLNFELFPGFTLAGAFEVVLFVGLALLFIKLFAK